MVFKWLKNYYLNWKSGFYKRPERLKLQGLLTVVPAKLRHEEEKYSRAAIINISRTGIAIECFSKFKIDEEVVLKFTLPTHHVDLTGTVVRSLEQFSTFIYGIKFHSDQHNLALAKQIVAFAKSELKKLKHAKQKQ